MTKQVKTKCKVSSDLNYMHVCVYVSTNLHQCAEFANTKIEKFINSTVAINGIVLPNMTILGTCTST